MAKELKWLMMAMVLAMILTATNLWASDPAVRSTAAMPVGAVSATPVPIVPALPADAWVDMVVLTANVAASYTIPATAKYIMFNATDTFLVSFTGTAAIPGTAVTNGSGSVINPVQYYRLVSGITSISLIGPRNCIVSISVFK